MKLAVADGMKRVWKTAAGAPFWCRSTRMLSSRRRKLPWPGGTVVRDSIWMITSSGRFPYCAAIWAMSSDPR